MASQPPPFGSGCGDERGDPDAFVLEDLTQGLHEWRNIQDIVRLSFVAFHKALQAQGDAIQSLTEQTELRALKSDVRAAFETHEELLEVRLRESRADDAGHAETPEASANASANAEILERVAALERRAETVEARLERFATKAELKQASEQTRTELDALLRDLRREVTPTGNPRSFPLRDDDASAYATKADLRSLRASTATSADLAALAADKVGVDEVNRALAEVSAALDEKAGAATLDAFARESWAALRGVAAEASPSVARWIWKSGRTKANGLVPWNVQSVNTDPENLRWERDKTFVRASAPGLYEVTFGFFARRKPAVRLLVDGEPVLAAVNSASYVTHHSSGRLTSATRHPAGNVTGLTLIDFLALPAKAKIAVVYEGETGAEGFLSLKKL